MNGDKETYMPIRYISPTTDFGFKKLLGDPRIMKGFLNGNFKSTES
ncbi:MAG: hypothetical protein IKR41_04345 [Bacteroidales bacterium]|nr:hypothetical protein [Bacteroidales bacterium]